MHTSAKQEPYYIITFASICIAFYLGKLLGIKYTNELRMTCDESFSKNSFTSSQIDVLVTERMDAEYLKIIGRSYESREVFMREFVPGLNIDLEGGFENVILLHKTRNISKSLRSLPLSTDMNQTKSCESMIVIGNKPKGHRQCLAYFNDYHESYHLQRWMRMSSSEGSMINENFTLVHVSREMTREGISEFVSPRKPHIKKHLLLLENYLNSLNDILQEINSTIQEIAINNTIVVMVCNLGQSPLLMNFACAAKSKSFNLNNVLIIATDTETQKIAKELGLAGFYNEKIFESIPSEAADVYSGEVFKEMMWAKMVATHLVSLLNYDFLFQDVDIVWNKYPIDFFKKQSKDFDMFFQDDGTNTLRFAPLRANSGFFFVRSNDKTRYLFTALLYYSAYMLHSGSHQETLIAIMSDFASLFALKVKTLDWKDFCGGNVFHNKDSFMKHMIAKEVTPYTFHMSWTHNMDNKLLFFQQMGMWFLNDKCLKANEGIMTINFHNCCLKKPNITCHFKDKPSVIPCTNSLTMDENGGSFW